MTTLFEKIKNIIKEDLQVGMEKKDDTHPIALLNKYLRESEEETNKVAKLIERQHMLKEEFQRELTQVEEMLAKRNKQAEIALKANEMTLHETAKHEEALYQAQAERLKEAYQQTSVQLEDLEKKHREMQMKLKDMHIKRLELMGRENAIQVNKKVNSVLDHSTDGKASSRFEDTQRYMDQLETNTNPGFDRNSFDAKIEQLEKELNEKNNNI